MPEAFPELGEILLHPGLAFEERTRPRPVFGHGPERLRRHGQRIDLSGMAAQERVLHGPERIEIIRPGVRLPREHRRLQVHDLRLRPDVAQVRGGQEREHEVRGPGAELLPQLRPEVPPVVVVRAGPVPVVQRLEGAVLEMVERLRLVEREGAPVAFERVSALFEHGHRLRIAAHRELAPGVEAFQHRLESAPPLGIANPPQVERQDLLRGEGGDVEEDPARGVRGHGQASSVSSVFTCIFRSAQPPKK